VSLSTRTDRVAPQTPATSLFRLQHSPELFPSTPRRCPERIATCRTTRTTRRFAMFCLGVALGEFQLPQLRGFCFSWSSRNHLGNKGKCRIRGQKATSRSDISSVSLVFCWPIWAKWFRISGRCVMRLSPLRWTAEKTAETGRRTGIERLPSNKEGRSYKAFAERRLQAPSPEISPSGVPTLYRTVDLLINGTRICQMVLKFVG
jgi:hypothetical protein